VPELSRFFGIIIRMYAEVNAPHHEPHFHGIIRMKWRSMVSIRLNWSLVHCQDAKHASWKHGLRCTWLNCSRI